MRAVHEEDATAFEAARDEELAASGWCSRLIIVPEAPEFDVILLYVMTANQIVFGVLPQVSIQLANNMALGTWPPVAIASLLTSAYIMVQAVAAPLWKMCVLGNSPTVAISDWLVRAQTDAAQGGQLQEECEDEGGGSAMGVEVTVEVNQLGARAPKAAGDVGDAGAQA
jgi:hypothetical protein